MSDDSTTIGKSVPLIHSLDKVTGRAKFTDDLQLSSPLIVKIFRSVHPSANIKAIDIQKVEELAGVRAVLLGRDIPNTFGVLPISKDEPALAIDRVRYVGEGVVAIACESEEIATKALSLIKVDYEITTPCFSPEKALLATDTPIHPELKKGSNLHKQVLQNFGDIDRGFSEADEVVEEKFDFPSINHAFTEPHATQVAIDTRGEITVYSATQVPHYLHRAISDVLEIPMHKIRVVKPHLGGGFGGKSDPFPHEIIAAKLAMITGRNTKIVFSREEVFFCHHGRHPSKISMKIGVSREKGITALDGNMLIDGGAYGSFGVVTTYYNGVLLQGPIKVPNYRFECNRVYTNKPMCGAMRGHGGVNPRYASEVLIDMACDRLKIDPCEFRLNNFLQPNSLTTNEFRITSMGIEQNLKQAMTRSDWSNKYRKLPFGKGIGVACGFFISGSALPIHWNQMPQSTVRLTIDYDGGVSLYSGASDIGQGSDTMLAQVAAEVLGLPIDMIKVISADTRTCPIDYGSYSSRVTFMAGNASKNAAIRMRKILVHAACQLLEISEPNYQTPTKSDDFYRQGDQKPDFESSYLGANPDYRDGFKFRGELITAPNGKSVPYMDVVRKALDFTGALQTKGVYISPKMGGNFKGSGAGLSPAYSTTVFITEVTIEPQTGFIKVDKVTCAHDCGKALNPLSVEGQLEGSIHMGLGQALMEEVIHHKGAVQNPSFLDYKIPSPFEMPEVDLIYPDSDESEGPFGGKEVGEGALAPFIPSIANAIYDAVGVRVNNLPITPDKILTAIKEGGPRC
ncbi:MAG: molybdopterin-dependent oxidoreductase [Bdellovibrionales bacterium]|nr:molybdopterin-dependent oxidoreductase [Bdellovibrionales bacterium]MBT3527176.1 molybdopterin-dependent oxidoreductase [Bdellovibrionales bacterium]MBT7669084.1 molybdopterin-dependent oxidoreductase [Bdellovibrionales bacterium]MBT7767196.1 molybdopterin-dependent oxidoreductase [Bdellovibrionales bacterium]